MLPNQPAELTNEQKEQLEAARKALPKLRAEIRKAKSAGLDMAAQEAQIDELQVQLDKLFRVYVRPTTGNK